MRCNTKQQDNKVKKKKTKTKNLTDGESRRTVFLIM